MYPVPPSASRPARRRTSVAVLSVFVVLTALAASPSAAVVSETPTGSGLPTVDGSGQRSALTDASENDPAAPSLTVEETGVAFAQEGVSAFRPAITEAPNGDILATFNTTGDVNPGGEIRLIRSTDGGRTWGESQVVKTSDAWGPDGSIYSSRGMTTLSDGTILLPFNDGINYSPYNNRDSELYVARSTDSGHTWTGVDTPIDLPAETREHWACCSRILELDDGSLLMPLWGTRELVEDWRHDPMRWRAAVVKSYDGGRTWEDYSTIAYDPHNPPGSRGTGSRGGGVNEPSIVQLDSGRLVAMIRYGQFVGPSDQAFNMYVSYSDDRGATWTDPAPTDPSLQAQTPSLAEAPSSAALPEGSSKLIFGHRTMPRSAPDGDLAAVSVSFDEGVTWEGRTFLEEPSGLPKDAFRAAEPDFLQLADGSLLTLFQYQPGFTGNYRLGYNVLEDRSAEETVADAQAAQARAAREPSLFFERQDRHDWPFGLALRQRSFSSSTLIRDVATQAAAATTCDSQEIQLIRKGDPNRPLDPDKSLAEAGVGNGDTLIVRSLQPVSPSMSVGITHWDAFPQTRHLYAWNDACDYGLELDAANRSLGVRTDLPGGQAIVSVSLRDTDASTRLTAADYSLWVSSDNDTFIEITGWDLRETLDHGRVVHTFTGLSVTDPYLKIHQDYSDSAPTFVLDRLEDDVMVTIAPRR